MAVCLRCGYDLRMTSHEAPCPECGLAAHRSVIEHVHPDDCPPRWVKLIAMATSMLLISYIGFCLFLAHIVWNGEPWWPWRWQFFPTSLLIGLAILHAIANIMLSRDERPLATLGISRFHRRALRILPILPIVGLGIIEWDFQGLWPNSFAGTFTASDELLGDLSALLIAPLALCPIFTFLRLRRLALRLSRPRVAEHVTIVAVGCAVSLVVILGVIFGTSIYYKSDVCFFMMIVLPWAVLWVFVLWATALLWVVNQRFKESAKEATARWRAADASLANQP